MEHQQNQSSSNSAQTPTSPPSGQPVRRVYIENEMSLSPTDTGSMSPEKHKRLNAALKLLMSWPSLDIWPFKIANPLLGFAAGIPGFVMNSAFRSSLVLSGAAKASSYFATVGIPACSAGAAHYLLITHNILAQDTMCPVCVQVKSASIQFAIGFLYPLTLVPLVGFSIGSKVKHLYLPKINKKPMELLRYTYEIFTAEKVRNRLLLAAAVQILLGTGVTYLEQNCYYNKILPMIEGDAKYSKNLRKWDKYPVESY